MSFSESVRDLQVALNTIVNLEKELNDKKLIDDVKVALQKAKKVVSDATGGALHRLDETNPSIDAVKQLVESIPDALSCKNEEVNCQFNQRFGTVVSNIFPFLRRKESKTKLAAEECAVGSWR